MTVELGEFIYGIAGVCTPQGKTRSQPDGKPVRGSGTQAGKSASSRVVVLAISSVLTLVTTRVAISFGGPHVFAYIALVGSLIALVPFSDLGTGAAVTNALAESSSGAQDPRVGRVVLTSVRTLSVVGVSVIAVSVLLLLTGAWAPILGLSPATQSKLPLAAAISFGCFGTALPFGIGQRILLGVGRNHLAVLCQVLSPLSSLLVVTAVASLGIDAALMACAPGVAALATGWVTTTVAGRASGLPIRDILRRVPFVHDYPGSSIKTLAGPMILISVALPLAFQSDRLVLVHFSSPRELATYSLSAQMYAPFWSVVSTAGLTLWPMFAQARVSGLNALGKLYRAILVLGGVALIGGLVLTILGPWGGRLLSGGDIVVSRFVLLGFAAMLIVQATHLPSGMALTDGPGLRFQACSVFAMLILNVALSILLTPGLGALGPLVASVASIIGCQLIPCMTYARIRLSFVPARVEDFVN